MVAVWKVHSDEAAWKNPWGTTIYNEQYCGTGGLVLVNKASGEGWFRRTRCETWWCSKCAPKRAEQVIEQFISNTSDLEFVWVAKISGVFGATERNRLKQRRMYKNAEYLLVQRRWEILLTPHPVFNRRNDWERGAWVFASDVLSGRLDPRTGKVVSIDQALILLTEGALRLPGVSRTSTSKGWALPGRASTGMWWSVGFHSENAALDALYALDQIEHRTGLRLTPESRRQFLEEEFARVSAD